MHTRIMHKLELFLWDCLKCPDYRGVHISEYPDYRGVHISECPD